MTLDLDKALQRLQKYANSVSKERFKPYEGEETIMCGKTFIPPLKPYQPTPYKKGCSQQREYDELTVYGDKHRLPAITTYCDYVDKKGKFVEKYLLRVKWISWDEYWFGLCEKEPLPLERFKELYESKFDPVIDEDIAKEFNKRQKKREDDYELKSMSRRFTYE